MEILLDILMRITDMGFLYLRTVVYLWFICGYMAAVLMFTTELLHGSNIWNIDFFFNTFVKFPMMGMVYLYRVFEALCNTWKKGGKV